MRLALLTSFLFVYFTQVTLGHNVLLPPYGNRCFFEDLKVGDELSISFQFGDRNPQSHAQLKGSLYMYSPNSGNVIHSMLDVSYGDITVHASTNGRYKYCFSNENSAYTTKDVNFNIYGVDFMNLDNPSAESLEGAVTQLSKLTKEIRDEQEYIILRERTHRNTAESTNDRVKWWSVSQLAVVVAQSLFQVYYLRRFFEVTSFV